MIDIEHEIFKRCNDEEVKSPATQVTIAAEQFVSYVEGLGYKYPYEVINIALTFHKEMSIQHRTKNDS